MLLKTRLDEQDWRLVFQNLDKAHKLAYQSGNFKSVQAKDLPERLAEHCGVDLEADFRQALDIVTAARNRLQHFGHTDSAEAVVAAIGRLISFLFDFVHAELLPEIPHEDVTEELERIRDGLAGIDVVVQARRTTVYDRIDDQEGASLTCPVCLETAWLSEPTNRCLFCGFLGDGEAAAVEWAVRVLGAGDYEAAEGVDQWPIYLCPGCRREALAANIRRYEYMEVDPVGWGCFACGMGWESSDLVQCESCGRPTLNEELAGVMACVTCRSWLLEQNGDRPL